MNGRKGCGPMIGLGGLSRVLVTILTLQLVQNFFNFARLAREQESCALGYTVKSCPILGDG
jgi:hypothetical protein